MAVTPTVIGTFFSHVRIGTPIYPRAQTADSHNPPPLLTCPVPPPQIPPPQADRPPLLRRGPQRNPRLPRVRVAPHRRGAPGLHRPMGAAPAVGEGQARDHPGRADLPRRRPDPRAARRGRREEGGRGDVVGVEEAPVAAAGRVDRDAGGLPGSEEGQGAGEPRHAVRARRGVLLRERGRAQVPDAAARAEAKG